MSEHRNRHYDKSIVGRVWHESKLWIHLTILACSAAIAWQVMAGDIAKSAEKNEQQDVVIQKLSEAMIAQSNAVARIEQKVDYIREDVQQIKREVR